MGKKPHLSSTQLDLFGKCPEAYRRRYIERERGKRNTPMAIGSAVHKSIEKNYQRKIDQGTFASPAEAATNAIEEFDSILQDTTSEPPALGKDEEVEAKAIASDIAAYHAAKVADEYEPKAVEVGFRVELPASKYDLVGYIDLETQAGTVVDWKISKKAPAVSGVMEALQYSVYSAFQVETLGLPLPVSQVQENLWHTKTKGVKRKSTSTTRDGTDLTNLANRIVVMEKMIDAGLFPAVSPQGWWCGQKTCQFYDSCQYVNGKRQTKEVEIQKAKELVQLSVAAVKEANK